MFKKRRILKKTLIWIGSILGGLVLLFVLAGFITPAAKPPYTLGVTFRYVYADSIGLNWRDVYLKMFTELHVKNVRIPVYWDRVEKSDNQYDFADLDYQVSTAHNYGAKSVIVVGRRVPSWPECYIPDWAKHLPFDQQQQKLDEEITMVVNRYKDDPSLEYWQVENEPFLPSFGICPTFDTAKALDQEIALVRKLDPNHKILTTDSGELSIWVRAAVRGDVFGSTLYKHVYSPTLKRYITYHLPPQFFRAKMAVVHLFHPGVPIINIELQAEPWTPGLQSTPFAEQAITYPPGELAKNIQFAHDSGFSTTYLWGVEYWYWAAAHGHPEFLQEAKEQLSK